MLHQPKGFVPDSKSKGTGQDPRSRKELKTRARAMSFDEGMALFKPPPRTELPPRSKEVGDQPEPVLEGAGKAQPEMGEMLVSEAVGGAELLKHPRWEKEEKEKSPSKLRREAERKSKAGELVAGLNGNMSPEDAEAVIGKALAGGLSVSQLGARRKELVPFLLGHAPQVELAVWALLQTGLDLAKAELGVAIAMAAGQHGKTLFESNPGDAEREQLHAWLPLIRPSFSDARFKALFAQREAVWLSPLLDGAHEAGLNHVADLLIEGKLEDAESWTLKAMPLDYDPALVGLVGTLSEEHARTSVEVDTKRLEQERDVEKEKKAKEARDGEKRSGKKELRANQARDKVVKEYNTQIEGVSESLGERTLEAEGKLTAFFATHKGKGAQLAAELSGGDVVKAEALMPLLGPVDNGEVREALARRALSEKSLSEAVQIAVAVVAKLGDDPVRAPAVYEFLIENPGALAQLDWIAAHLLKGKLEDLEKDLGYLGRFDVSQLPNLAYAIDQGVDREVVNALGNLLGDSVIGRWALDHAKGGTLLPEHAVQLRHLVSDLGGKPLGKQLAVDAWDQLSGDRAKLLQCMRSSKNAPKIREALTVATTRKPDTVAYFEQLLEQLGSSPQGTLETTLDQNPFTAAKLLLEAALDDKSGRLWCTDDRHYSSGDKYKGGAQRTGIFKTDVTSNGVAVDVHNHYRENSVARMTSLHIYLNGAKGPELMTNTRIGQACVEASKDFNGRTKFTA